MPIKSYRELSWWQRFKIDQNERSENFFLFGQRLKQKWVDRPTIASSTEALSLYLFDIGWSIRLIMPRLIRFTCRRLVGATRRLQSPVVEKLRRRFSVKADRAERFIYGLR